MNTFHRRTLREQVSHYSKHAGAAAFALMASGAALATPTPGSPEAFQADIVDKITVWGAAAVGILTAFLAARWVLKAMRIIR